MILNHINRHAGKYLAATVVLTFAACRPFIISDVDYAQPIESVLEVQHNGMVDDIRSGLKFSVMPLQYRETEDTTSVTTPEIRIIRSHDGYYFVTAPGYAHVYIFRPDEERLRLHRSVLVDENGVANPAFNQRAPEIELLDGTERAYRLNRDGLVEE